MKAICEEDTIFLPSFPLEHLSVKELEAVASGPIRFASLMKRHGRSKAQMDQIATTEPQMPRYERTLTFDVSSLQSLPQNLLFNIPKLYLIPGGRFLVLSSRNVLQLWDLGIFLTESSRKDPMLLAQHVSDHDDVWRRTSVHSNAADNGESIRIARCNHDRWVSPATKGLQADPFDARNTIQILEIFPSAANPEFKILRTAQTLIDGLCCISVCGNLLVIVCEHIIKLWDFVENTWASFGIEKEPIHVSPMARAQERLSHSAVTS